MRILFSIIFILIFSPTAYPQELVELSTIYVNGVYISGLYVDIDSVTPTDHDTITVNVYEHYPRPIKRKVFNSYMVDTIANKYEVDCVNATRKKYFELHYLNEELVGSSKFNEDFSELSDIGMKMYDMICY